MAPAATRSAFLLLCLFGHGAQGSVVAPADNTTGGDCETMRNQGESMCMMDMRASCVGGSACQTALVQALQVCSDDHVFWNGDEWKNSKLDLMEAQAGMEYMCSDCGLAYWDFVNCTGMMDDEQVEGPDMMNRMCEGTCRSLLDRVNATCTDEDTMLMDGQDMPMRQMFEPMFMMCSGCMASFMGIEAACSDPASMCDERGSCASAKAQVRADCPPGTMFPSDGNDDSGEEMTVESVMGMLEMMCGGCMMEMAAYGEECSEDQGRALELCTDGSACHDKFWGMQVSCRPGLGDYLEACMMDETSCECRMGNATFCEAEGMHNECSGHCAGFTHPSCMDPTSCNCMIAKEEDFCEGDHTGCEAECGQKSMADMMLLAMFGCAFQDGAGSGGKCVSLPASHPVWRSEAMMRYRPRECHEGSWGDGVVHPAPGMMYPSPGMMHHSPSMMYSPSYMHHSPSMMYSPSYMHSSPSSWRSPSMMSHPSPSMMHSSPSSWMSPSMMSHPSPSMMHSSPSSWRSPSMMSHPSPSMMSPSMMSGGRR